MKPKVEYLGIDIGGAHIKIVCLNIKKEVCYVGYKQCPLWKGIENLKREIKFINSLITNKNNKCCITMTGELCDIFKNRRSGAKEIIKVCKLINCRKFYYTKLDEMFTSRPKFDEIISMNWHSIGKLSEKKVKNAILIDFGSTTTDLICIKNGQMKYESSDDFGRINNSELLYTGFMRTPLFAITPYINYIKKRIKLIPENFSNTSDIYRIKKEIKKNFDIDNTLDNRSKTLESSMQRVSRSLGFDFKKEDQRLIKKISEEISNIQLKEIAKKIFEMMKTYGLKKNTSIIISGIGQDVLINFLKSRKKTVLSLANFIKGRNRKLNKIATYHAPALSIAILLADSK